MKTKVISAGGQNVFIRHSALPAAPAVIFVHGVGASGKYWLPLAGELKNIFELYILDMPGFGKSSKPQLALTTLEQGKVLHELIIKLKLEPTVLVGHSYGCQIILEYLQEYGTSTTTRAILLGPTTNSNERSRFTQILRLAQDSFHEPPKAWWLLITDYLLAGARRTLQTLSFAVQDKPEEKIRVLKLPILLIRGSKDKIVPLQWLSSLHQLAANSQILNVEHAAHGVHISHPADLSRIIKNYIK